jgi:hypothetical protein
MAARKQFIAALQANDEPLARRLLAGPTRWRP